MTPERTVECGTGTCLQGRSTDPGGRGPARIRWDELTEQKVAAIPLLGELRPEVS